MTASGLVSGLAAQLGFKAETTWGTAVTVDTFLPLVSETMKMEYEWLESGGIIPNALMLRQAQHAQGKITVGGDLGFELYDRSLGTLLQHCLGAVATTGTTAPYTHTYTVSNLTGKGLTVQIGRPDRNGTVQPFTYAGCKVASWQLGVKAAEIATFGVTLVGKSETTVTGLTTATFTSPVPAPMTAVYTGGSFSLAGSSLCVREVKINGDNKLNTDRRCIGTRFIDEPAEMDRREITGEITLELPDLYHYNRFVTGTTGAMAFTLQNMDGSSTLLVSANVRTNGSTPNVNGRDLTVHTLSFKAEATNTDASAFSMVLTNSDAT